jgi:Binding-protein-dependent transport system inner membrane component
MQIAGAVSFTAPSIASEMRKRSSTRFNTLRRLMGVCVAACTICKVPNFRAALCPLFEEFTRLAKEDGMFKQQNGRPLPNVHLLQGLEARSMGGTLSQRVMRVVIPAAIPAVLPGLRVGGAPVIVGVVVSEMLISSAGIGYLISRYRTISTAPMYSPACCWCWQWHSMP